MSKPTDPNKKVVIILALIDALYPDAPLMVSKGKEEIVVKNGAEGLVIPFKACREMSWKHIYRQLEDFMEKPKSRVDDLVI